MMIVRNSVIPFSGTIAITLWPFILVRRNTWTQFTNNVLRHKRIHGRQQVEMLLVGAAVAAILFVFGCKWWNLLALPLFFWLYGLEWMLGLFWFGNSKEANLNISFEREAYDNEQDADYLKKRRPFASIRYLF